MSDIFTADNLKFLIQGAGISLLLALGAVAIGCLIGTPMLLQILFFYLGIPVLYQRITGTRMSANPYVVGLLSLSFNSGAYQTELIRSGIQGVDKGQWEACETLGIGYGTMMKEIILPQAFRHIIPPLVSEFITLIKDSSLISSIGALELLYRAEVLGKKYYDYLDPLIMAGIIYLILTIITSWLSKKLERRMAVSD